MSKKKYKPILSESAIKEQAPAKTVRREGAPSTGNVYKTWFFILLAAYVALFGVFVVILSSSGGGASTSQDSNISTVLGKSYVELGRREEAPDPEDPSYSLTYWTWTDRNNAWGYCADVPIPLAQYPSILLIVDPNIKILKLQPMSEFSTAGIDRRAELKDVLTRYEGRTLVDFVNLETTISEGETRVFREVLRDNIAKALKVMYVKINGLDQFKATFPQGIKFAKIGTKLNPWSTVTKDGLEVSDAYYRGRKYAIFTTTSCGSCINTVMGLAGRLQTEGGMSADQVIVVFTSAKDKSEVLKSQLKGEHVIYDENMKGISKTLNLFEGPSMMLIDGKGVVFAKEPSNRLSDSISVDKVLQMYFKEQ